jgi:hypothetical protein
VGPLHAKFKEWISGFGMGPKAERFEDGARKTWENVCEDDGISFLDDSAIAKAFGRERLLGVHRILERRRVLPGAFVERPSARWRNSGVFTVNVNGIVIVRFELLEIHFARRGCLNRTTAIELARKLWIETSRVSLVIKQDGGYAR